MKRTTHFLSPETVYNSISKQLVLFFDILVGDKLDKWPANGFSKTKCCVCFLHMKNT